MLTGSYSWVGFASLSGTVRKGILNPVDAYPGQTNAMVRQRLEALYARDYKAINDFRIIVRAFPLLGRRVVSDQ